MAENETKWNLSVYAFNIELFGLGGGRLETGSEYLATDVQ